MFKNCKELEILQAGLMRIIVFGVTFALFSLLLPIREANTRTNAKEILHLGVFNDLRGLVPAMNIALETIENDTTLPFTFNYIYNDTMVSYNYIAICLKLHITS